MGMSELRRRVFWVCLYAVAMAAVESAVVVYLRALHPGDAPVIVLLSVIPNRLIPIELGREAATIAMLLAVGILAGRDRWERVLLFLIPVPWLGPVLAPVTVSVCLVGGSLWLLVRYIRGAPAGLPTFAWV